MKPCRGTRLTKELVKKAGLEIVEMAPTGKAHIRCRVRAPDGREENQLFALTHSDSRYEKNQLAQLKRFARGHSSITERKSQ